MEIEDIVGLIFIGILCVFVGVFGMGLFMHSFGVTDGQHTGYVTAVERNEGMIYSDTLVYFKTDLESSQEDIYCVNDPELKTRLEIAARNKVPVTISYHNDFILYNSECYAGSTIITGVV